jgi:hypothetical protein
MMEDTGRDVHMRSLAAVFLLAAACGSNSGSGGDANGSGSGGPDGNTTVTIMDDSGTWSCTLVQCAGKSLECNDCVDNDVDGFVDSHDPECLGPCDNTEGPGLESGVGGTTGTSCGVDCYFDFGNGPGNDECMWDHRCDSLEPELPTCGYDASMVGTKDCPATQDPTCAEVCRPLTPNGCDCFGCCTFANAGPGGVGSRSVWIGAMDSSNNSTCTLADVANEDKCPTCTPVANCYNQCDQCEVCIGSTPDPSCDPSMQCPAGYQACGLAGQAECPAGSYCVTGCCQAVLL